MIPSGGFVCVPTETFYCNFTWAVSLLHLVQVPAQWGVELWEIAKTSEVLNSAGEAHLWQVNVSCWQWLVSRRWHICL